MGFVWDFAVLDLLDEGFVGLPIHAAEFHELTQLLTTGGVAVGLVDEFRAVNFLIVQPIPDVVGPAEVVFAALERLRDVLAVFVT